MSFPKYTRYKDSSVEWLGEVPEHWTTQRLKFIFSTKKRIAGAEGFDVLSITQQGIVIKNIEGNKGQFSDDYSKYQIVECGDFAMNGMDLLTGYVDLSIFYGVTSPDYRVFSLIDEAAWDKDYLLRLLQNGYKQKIFYAFGQGASQLGRWRFPTQAFNDFIFPRPPKAEQSAIAALLDRETAKIDALVAEQEKLIELLKEKRQAVISNAVTKGLDPNVPMKDSGVEWLVEVPEHWGHPRKLNDLAAPERHAFVNGPFGSDLLTSELTTEGVPVIYIRDIKEAGYIRVSEWCVTREKADDIRFCNVIPDDILIAKVGDPPGLAVVYPKNEPEGIVTQDVIRIRVDRSFVHPFFLRYCMNSDYGKAIIDNISVESTRTRVSLGEYKTLRFVLPPLEEQMKISCYLDEVTEKLNSLQLEAQLTIDLLKERRSALISAAVIGKIDVRELANATQ